jgi:diguanylate cyclase
MIQRIFPQSQRSLGSIGVSLVIGVAIAAIVSAFGDLIVVGTSPLTATGVGALRSHPMGIAGLIVTLAAVGIPLTLVIRFYAPALSALGVRGGDVPVERRVARFADELPRALAAARERTTKTEAHLAALRNAEARLLRLPAPEQVRVVVSLLVAENERARKDILKMNAKLKSNLTTIEKLSCDVRTAEHIALNDPLTGLGNRRYFDQQLTEAVGQFVETGRPASLILCDLDHFKALNDTFGHLAGDEVLRMLATVLKSSVRSSDRIVRYGGEEFAVILPGARLAEASDVAEKIRAVLAAKAFKIRSADRDLGQVTASFGVGQLLAGEDEQRLFARVDTKLYQAKQNGRNRVEA